MLRLLFVIFTLLVLPYSCRAIDFEATVSKFIHLEESEFLNQFPFDEYIRNYDLENVDSLEAHKEYLNRLGFAGDYFLMKVFENHLKDYSIDFNQLDSIKQLLTMAEVMRHSANYLPDSIIVYKAIGSLILKGIADSLEVKIENGSLDKKDFDIRYIITRLGDNNYLIDTPISNLEKLWKNLKEGNIRYLLHKATTTYLKEFILFLCLAIPFVGLFGWYILRFFKKRRIQKNADT